MNPPGSFEIGIVVAVYPEGNSVDVLIPDSGSRLSNVQVMSGTGSENTGILDLPDPGLPADDTRWNVQLNPQRYIRAIVGSYRDTVPFVFGFLFPQECQMTFQRKNFRVNRHASDVYSTVNQNGDMEVYHPSGTFLRIAETTPHEDLTQQDFDSRWKIANNTTRVPYVHLEVANGGSTKLALDIDPSGNMTVTTPGTVSFNGLTIDANGNLVSPGTVTGQTQVVAGMGGNAVHLTTHKHPTAATGAPSAPTPGT